MKLDMACEQIAIISPLSFPPAKLVERLSQFVSADVVLSAVWLSNAGTHFDINNCREKPAHIFSSLNKKISRIFVIDEFPVLYPSQFTLGWLLSLFNDVGEGGKLYIQSRNTEMRKKRGQITRVYLETLLPVSHLSIAQDGWCIVSWSEQIRQITDSLQTIYTKLHGRFDQFVMKYKESLEIRELGNDGGFQYFIDPLRAYIYSLFGAGQKSFVVRQIIKDYLGDSEFIGFDMGGGYGFMAAELAVSGQRMYMTDCMSSHLHVAEWLSEILGIQEMLNIGLGKIEDICSTGERYHFISIFGALLYVKRDLVAEVIKSAMESLLPGGILMIHESPREAAKPGSKDYETRFRADELYGLLCQNGGQPDFYSMFSGSRVEWDQIKHRFIMAVVQKST